MNWCEWDMGGVDLLTPLNLPVYGPLAKNEWRFYDLLISLGAFFSWYWEWNN
jgi:hypothetical protein